jgi:ATP-dependent RNA helicase RhlE
LKRSAPVSNTPRAGESTDTPAVPQDFLSLGMLPQWVNAAHACGFTHATPVQTQATPHVLAGADLLATAPTGSGKTLAYVLPLLQRLSASAVADDLGRKPTRLLVLVPTRELAEQVGETAIALLRSHATGLRVVVAVGGVSINPQMLALRGGVDVVVATPGRLLDLMDKRALSLRGLQTLVLDEADRMLDAGFADELQDVLSRVPGTRQTLMFSATFAPAVKTLAQATLSSPVTLELAPVQEPHAHIAQTAIAVDEGLRTQLLKHLVQTQEWTRVLVFVATRYATIHVADKLYRAGINATPFHGEMGQTARQEVLADFKSAQWQVVVTTDLAARGIDVAQLDAVINYDLPRSATDYTHRIGRTGRAGLKGEAISLVTAAQRNHWAVIQKRNGLTLPLEVAPGFEPKDEVSANPQDPKGNGGIKGKRPSKKDKLRAAALVSARTTPK